jgi:hypothetical protein
MILARINEHYEVLVASAAREVVELDTLMPVDRTIGIAEHHEHGRAQFLDLVNG